MSDKLNNSSQPKRPRGRPPGGVGSKTIGVKLPVPVWQWVKQQPEGTIRKLIEAAMSHETPSR